MKNAYCFKKFNALLLGGFVSAFTFSFTVKADTLIEQAQILMDAEKTDKAYALLSTVADEQAGEAEFDYIYGVLLQKMNQHTYAVMVLERALLMRPNHIETQTALAKSYIALKEFEKADKLQQQLQQEGVASISTELDELEAQKKETEETLYTFNGFIRSSFGYDDNLTSGPEDDYLTIPIARHLGSIYVGNGLQKDQDFFYALSGNLGLNVQFANGLGVNAGIWGSHRLNRKRPDEDLSIMSSWLGGSYQYGKNNFNFNFKYQSLWINTLHYQDQYLLQGQWYRPILDSNAIALHFNIRTAKHPSSETLDYDAYTAGAIFYQQLDWLWQPMLSLEVYGGEEKLQDPSNEYLGYANIGTRLAARVYFNQQSAFLFSSSFEDRHYKQQNPFFLTTRHDHNFSISGKYSHFFFDKQLELSAQGTWMLNSSNISLYDYQRTIASINIQWNF